MKVYELAKQLGCSSRDIGENMFRELSDEEVVEAMARVGKIDVQKAHREAHRDRMRALVEDDGYELSSDLPLTYSYLRSSRRFTAEEMDEIYEHWPEESKLQGFKAMHTFRPEGMSIASYQKLQPRLAECKKEWDALPKDERRKY